VVTVSLFLGSFSYSFYFSLSSLRWDNISAMEATAATGVPSFYFASIEFPNEPQIYPSALLGE